MKIKSRYKKILLSILIIPAIAILVIFIIDPNLLSPKTQGSFEYIRKGEALLDKGKYVEAIKYYEMAYAASPDSDEIKNGLVYAYSKYAVKLAESERYNMGVKYLSKANDIAGSAYTRQNLSLMYAKKAVFEARSSDRTRAREDLDMAREIAGDSVACGRSLGITLFNDAVVEFKAGKEDNAILLIRTALSVYGDSSIYEFLGDIYYKKTELEKARSYFNKAAKLDPDNKKLAEKCEKVSKEEALSINEKASVLPYFDLRYDEDLPVNADLTAKILEKAYFDIGKDLEYLPGTRTVVFFYSEKNFRDIFKTRDMVRAFYDGNIRIPLPGSVSDEKELVSYLYHEYTHAILSAKTNNNCPVWLSEGIAVYEEFKWTRPGAAVNISKNTYDIPVISIKAIDQIFKDPGTNPNKLVVAYILAYTAIEFIVDNWGLKGLHGVLDAIALGRHAVNAMDDEFLLSEKDFNRRWSDFVGSKYIQKKGG